MIWQQGRSAEHRYCMHAVVQMEEEGAARAEEEAASRALEMNTLEEAEGAAEERGRQAVMAELRQARTLRPPSSWHL